MTPDQIRELAGQTAQGISADALSGKPFNPMMASLKLQTGTMFMQAETAAHLAEQNVQLTRIADALEVLARHAAADTTKEDAAQVHPLFDQDILPASELGKGEWEPR